MKIEHVSHHVAEMILSTSRELDFDLGAFMRATGMPDPKVGPVSWDEFTLFIDAIVDESGYDALEEVVGDLERLVPSSIPLLSTFVSPERLYGFVNKVMAKSMYPMLIAEHQAHADGTLSLVTTLRDGFRPCANFFRVNQASQAAIPAFIGLPRATVRAEWHPRGARYLIRPPASRTLVSRTRRSLEDTWVAALAEEFQREKQRLADAYDRLWATTLEFAKQGRELRRARDAETHLARELEARAERDLDVTRRAADLTAELGLTKRQGEVLACLLAGASNKEIAASLGCSPRTVEVHVSNILQRAGLDGRTSLIAYAFSGHLSSRR